MGTQRHWPCQDIGPSNLDVNTSFTTNELALNDAERRLPVRLLAAAEIFLELLEIDLKAVESRARVTG